MLRSPTAEAIIKIQILLATVMPEKIDNILAGIFLILENIFSLHHL